MRTPDGCLSLGSVDGCAVSYTESLAAQVSIVELSRKIDAYVFALARVPERAGP